MTEEELLATLALLGFTDRMRSIVGVRLKRTTNSLPVIRIRTVEGQRVSDTLSRFKYLITVAVKDQYSLTDWHSLKEHKTNDPHELLKITGEHL